MDIQALIQSMTLKEKLAEITQLYGSEISDDDSTFMGINYRFPCPKDLETNIGSILGVAGAKRLKMAQKKHLEISKNKIPLLFMHDTIHGFKTIFPSPLAMSCTWQPELVKKSAEIAAKEAAVSGIHVTFSPMCDLARDARWGRVVETSGEDPYLSSLFAQAYVAGYQGENPAVPYKVASCAKHFAAYGLAEAGRDYNRADASEYELRENHLPLYKAAVDAGCKMVMTAFNALNGIPASGNQWLLKDVLRGEWNFTGSVISDCTSIIEMIYHGFAEDEKEAAEKALSAGVDMEMVSNTYYNCAEELIKEEKITLEQIDSAVKRILELKQSLGLFENPYKDADEEQEKKIVLCSEHRKAARKIAAESMVLLKNDGLLPLKEKTKILLTGPFAESRKMLDSWSAYGQEKDCSTLHETLEEKFSVLCIPEFELLDKQARVEEVRYEIEQYEAVVLALGEDPLMSGESNSRMDICIPEKQQQLFDLVKTWGKPVIVILYNGRPLAIRQMAQDADAILEAWFPGTEGNEAVRDIISGSYLPGGRLTMSFPYDVGQCPIYYNSFRTGRPAEDPVQSKRFTSRYIDGPSIPLYPFGYGLTYTEFQYSDFVLSASSMKRHEKLYASCVVRNIGKYAGTETVQLYLQDVAASRVRPVRMLKGYQRVTLEPEETMRVMFEITEEMLKFNSLKNGYCAESGRYRVCLAKDANEAGKMTPMEFTLQ